MTATTRIGKNWYLVYAKPRQEKSAIENLERQKYEVYLPQIQLWRTRRGKRQLVIEPLFPRYLFIHLDAQTDNWAPIRSTLGVTSLVRFGTEPARVPDELIHYLRSRQNAAHLVRLHAGYAIIKLYRGVIDEQFVPRLRELGPMSPAGYSGTPLVKKLGIKEGMTLGVLGAPAHFLDLLEGLPDDVVVRTRAQGHLDLLVSFHTARAHFEQRLPAALKAMDRNGGLWVAWPKKASKVPSDMTEDVVREVVLPIGLVDVKVCAIDDTWSGLRVVWRKERR